MEPLNILLIVLAVVAIWAVVELALTLRKARVDIDEISHSATEAIDQATPIIAKLDGVVDELEPALRELTPLVEKTTIAIDEANVSLKSVSGILGDVSSATHGVASVGDSASRIVNTATSAAVGVVSKVASLGGITIPEGRGLIGDGKADEKADKKVESAAPAESEPEPAAPRGGYVTYAPVSGDDAE